MTIIRTAKYEDLPTLLQFEQGVIEAERPFCPDMQQEKFHYYDLAELLNKDTAEAIVAEEDGQLVGAGYAEIRETRHYYKHDKISYLGFMYVLPEWRGQGINQRIMDALFQWSHQQGIEHFVLDVFSGNASAIKAYEKVGFKPLLTEMILHKPV